MGREVKRVSLEFDWPLNERWEGYVNPHYRRCPDCDGKGLAPHGRYLEDVARMITLGGSYPDGHPAMRRGRDSAPGPEWAALSGALAGRAPRPPFGHDSCDQWGVAKALCEAAGLDEKWGWCSACEGEGIDPEARDAYEAWERTEPPAGDGWQMWETTSEGSPISPVFKSPEALAQWLADNNASAFGSQGATYEQWLSMIRVGWAPSAVAVDGRLTSGVDAAGSK